MDTLEFYLSIPEPEIWAVIWTTRYDMAAVWTPGYLGHTVGMISYFWHVFYLCIPEPEIWAAVRAARYDMAAV